MAQRPCPHCELPIDDAATACPFCYQPVDPPAARASAASAGRRGGFSMAALWPRLGVVAGLCLLALLVQVIFYKPRRPAAAPAPAAAPPPAPPAAPAKPAPPPLKLTTLDPSSKGERWQVRGRLFDVVSLAGKPNAQLVFKDVNDGQLYGAKTDAQGLFSVLLPATLGGFVASLDGEGRIMEDLIPSLRTMSPDQRLEMIRGNPEEAWSPNVMAAAGTKIDKVYAFVPASVLSAQPQSQK